MVKFPVVESVIIMRKYVIMTYNEIIRLYRRNHYVFIVLIITQILTVFAFIFFSSTVVSSRYEYSSALESLRLYTIQIEQNVKYEEVMNIIDHIPFSKPENIRFYFTDGTNNFLSVLYPEKEENKNVGKGLGISQLHIDDKSHVVVAGITLPDYSLKNINVGDVLILGNQEFDVIGIRNIQMTELPYTTAFEFLDLLEMHIIMPPNMTSQQRDTIVSTLTNNYNVSVTPPRSVLQKTLVSLLLPFIACIFIGIFSVLTFIYIHLYMIDKCKYDFSVMTVCGAKTRYNIFIIITMFISIFSISFFISSVMYFLIYRSILPIALVVVYLFFVFLLVILLIPNTIKFVRHTIAQELKR